MAATWLPDHAKHPGYLQPFLRSNVLPHALVTVCKTLEQYMRDGTPLNSRCAAQVHSSCGVDNLPDWEGIVMRVVQTPPAALGSSVLALIASSNIAVEGTPGLVTGSHH
jgi:hypothetical protein